MGYDNVAQVAQFNRNYIHREICDRSREADLLVNLAVLAQSRNDPTEQRRLNTEAVRIW